MSTLGDSRKLPRKHVVITGTGRAGTTFLVELLTRCGLDTGFSVSDLTAGKDSVARAGLEHDVRDSAAPYIIKSPWFCDYADEVLQREDIIVEHILVPIRDLRAAAESRRYVQQLQLSQLGLLSRLLMRVRSQPLAGGLWHTQNGVHQEGVLLGQLYKLMYAASSKSVPLTLMQYPRIVEDSIFLYEKIEALLSRMSYAEFHSIHRETARVDLVSQF